MRQNKTIGILGGSFNPVNLGHVGMANFALDKVDEVWMVPTFSLVHGKKLVDFDMRVDMLKLSLENESPLIKVSDIEKRLALSGYFKDLWEALNKEHPDNIFYIIGEDVADNIDKFYMGEFLKKNVRFILMQRTGYEPKTDLSWVKNNGGIELLDFKMPCTISSTIARECIIAEDYKKALSQMHSSVLDYILKNNLFKN